MTPRERRAESAYRKGLQAGNSGHPAVAAKWLHAGLAELGWHDEANGSGEELPAEHRPRAALLLISLAFMESERGRVEYGLRLIDQAEQYAAPADRGRVVAQRGLLLSRTGRWQESLAQLEAAEALLDKDEGQLATLLLNRGVLRLDTADVRSAGADLRRAREIADKAGAERVAAKATHNLGYCELLSGDIPAALHLFGEAAAAYKRIAPGNMPVLETDRARALLAVGLAAEAASGLDDAVADFRRQRLGHYLAEAELARAQAAIAVGDPVGAKRWATAAMRRFRARGNEASAALAELTRLRARGATAIRMGDGSKPSPRRPRRPPVIAADAQQLAERLRSHGLRFDAALAELIAARALLAAGRREEAVSRLTAIGGARNLPLETLLLRQLVRAELAVFDGLHSAALARLRTGLAMLHTRRGQLGSFDLQTGATALGEALASKGLRLALERGTTRQVFSWLERSHAQAFRVRPVRPPADPEEAAVFAELRQLSVMIRAAELNGSPEAASIARRNELQRTIRQRSWQASGLGVTIAEATARDIAGALGESGQRYAGILARDGRLLAVTISGERVRLVELGDLDVAMEAARRLSADLDAQAGRWLPDRLAAVIRDSIRHQTEILAEHVVGPLLPVLKDDGAVIVPVGTLASVPWSMLPGLRGRPVTIAPSASSWLASWRSLRSGEETREKSAAAAVHPLLVAGPDLRHAIPEVTEIAKIYPGSSPLTNQKATVEQTLQALDGAELAHLAAHGHHDRDNVLFSRLDLADGPLMAYDIQRLSTAPKQVVLSACDVGRTIVRPGDEILGFTAALLHIGTPTVISSVTRVADDAATGLMTAYHRELRKGIRPAEALATASEAEQFCPFVCFGAG